MMQKREREDCFEHKCGPSQTPFRQTLNKVHVSNARNIKRQIGASIKRKTQTVRVPKSSQLAPSISVTSAGHSDAVPSHTSALVVVDDDGHQMIQRTKAEASYEPVASQGDVDARHTVPSRTTTSKHQVLRMRVDR
jgi:hypothetical protein